MLITLYANHSGHISMDLSIYDCHSYRVKRIHKNEAGLYSAYIQLLEKAYSPLGFLQPKILPKPNALCFGLFFHGGLEGIFAITPISEIDETPYIDLIPGATRSQRFVEITNVVVQKRVRGAVALRVMLYEAAQFAVTHGYSALVGITRHQTLPFFVDFGATPIFHEPLHLMGDYSINDFAIYFDASNHESIAYMHTRAKRFFEKELVLAKIRHRGTMSGARALVSSASESMEAGHGRH